MELLKPSTTTGNLSPFFGNENTKFLLVDGDNYPDVAKIFLESVTPEKIPDNLQCFSFISNSANFKAMNLLGELHSSWFHIVKACTDAKDAADANIAFVAGILAFNLKITNPIALVSRDKFAMETRASIQTISPGRDVRLIDPANFKSYIDELYFSPPKTQSPRKYPRKTSGRPPVDYRCKFCATKGDSPTAHWCNQCPDRPLTPMSRPKTGYVCDTCGKAGGLPDSHWKEACVFGM
jgi:hypothetical protein